MLTSTLALPTRVSEPGLNIMNISRVPLGPPQAHDVVTPKNNTYISNDVIQALEVARDSPEAACHGTIRDLLESALTEIWDRVLADQSRYVMTRDEFAIFNFFQDRFRNNPIAVMARKRYWDNLSIPSPSQDGA
ncbi:hypothetical protein GGR55DRAFT_600972 [Xylaria sp. FL0064]|nr:hypothetical protein GGR55DRAFT_600972 [Xylaria sp. FL0064]